MKDILIILLVVVVLVKHFRINDLISSLEIYEATIETRVELYNELYKKYIILQEETLIKLECY